MTEAAEAAQFVAIPQPIANILPITADLVVVRLPAAIAVASVNSQKSS